MALSPLQADILGPTILLLSLFLPMILGIICLPLALYYCRGPLGWCTIVLIVIDFVIPLSPKVWPQYLDLFMRPLASAFRVYFPRFGLHVDPDFKLNENRRYLLCAHPHGIFGMYFAIVADLLSSQGKYMRAFAAPVLLQLPLARRHFSWLGLASADAGSMRKAMKAKDTTIFWSTPGGIEEAFCVPCPEEQIVVEKRKGFCKIALQCGTDLVPVYGFGNNQMFPVLSGRQSLLAKVSAKLNVTLMAWTGRWGVPFSFVPVKHPQLVAIGKPILVEQCDTPSQKQIDDLHAQYCVAIRALFDKHKSDPVLEKAGFSQRRLLFESEKQPR